MRYETAYFCTYAKLPNAVSTDMINGALTLGLKIRLDTGIIEDVSITLISELAKDMVKSYLVNRHIVNDYDAMVDEIYYRHQGNAAKSIIKALGDAKRSYIELMEKSGHYLRGETDVDKSRR
jgi:hypothetical protein